MKTTALLTAALASSVAAGSASAAIVYTENFDGLAALPAGFSSAGHYGNPSSALETNTANTANGSELLYFETDHLTSAFFNSGDTASPISLVAGDEVKLSFDLFEATDFPTDLTDGPIEITLGISGSTSFLQTFQTEPGTGLSITGVAPEAGDLTVYFGSNGGTAYAQAELDNLSIDVTSVPEPASIALVALGGVALLGRRSR